MSKPLIGVLYALGVIGLVIGIVLLVLSAAGGTYTVNSLGGTIHHPGNVPLFIAGLVTTIVAALLLALAWAVVLIKLALSQHWTWLVWVVVFSVIALPVYLFAGPSTPASQTGRSSFQ